MKHQLSRLLPVLLVLVLALTPALTALAQGDDTIPLIPFESEQFGLTALVPEGWAEAAPGVFARGAGDPTSIIVQAAPGTSMQQLTDLLLGQLGLPGLPEESETLETAPFTWTIYVIPVELPGDAGTIMIDLGLAEADGTTYLVLMQSAEASYASLHANLFLPVLESVAPVGFEAGAGDDSGEAGDAAQTYTDPAGFFSISIPTNWTADQQEGYVTLRAPEDAILFHVLTLAADAYPDLEAAVAAGWEVVQPGFALDYADDDQPQDLSGIIPDYEEHLIIMYDSDDETIVQGIGVLYQGTAYIQLFEGETEAIQRRAAQINILNTGFTITAIEEDSLVGAEPVAFSPELLADLDSYAAEMLAEMEVPGAAYAIVRDGEIVHTNALGVRDMDTGEPMTVDTQMLIGSTTKTMTTFLMAALVDAGVLEWTTPVVDILPDFAVMDPEITQTLTVENLVCACTGVPRRDFEMIFNANELSAEGVIESLATFEFFTDFGEAFQYSNQMVATGGYIAALAAGGEYGDLGSAYTNLMQTRVFDAIGLPDTTFDDAAVQAAGRFATPHGVNLSLDYYPMPLEEETFWLEPINPAGGAWSTVEDMARYMITLINEGVTPEGEQLVSADVLRYVWEPQVSLSATGSYGLGWIIDEYKGLALYSHGGNTLGFSTDFAFLPEAGIGIVLINNGRLSNTFNQSVQMRLLELAYSQDFEFDAQVQQLIELSEAQEADLLAQLGDTVDPDAVADYLDVPFVNDAVGEITFSLDADGRLLLDAGEFVEEIRPRLDADSGEVEGYWGYDVLLLGLNVAFDTGSDGSLTVTLGSGVNEYIFTPAE